MYRHRRIAVVIPIHNEENFVEATIRSVPDFIDTIIVVDDGSCDGTSEVIAGIDESRVQLIRHLENHGVGAATVSGYRAAAASDADIVAVMDGDGQMDPDDLPALLDALIDEGFDYVKGNRFLHPSIENMPRSRYTGNRFLSALMRLALGLRAPLDGQCGYTAIKSDAIRALDLERLYPRYGFLNALLFSLLSINAKIGCVPVRTIYGQEISGINPFITIPIILSIIAQGYLRRVKNSHKKTHKEDKIYLPFSGY
jgi:glycosyltransferase involved in cell wall biosynthesis